MPTRDDVMSSRFAAARRFAPVAASIIGAAIAVAALAQTPGPSPGRQALESRKAVFTLIEANFRPLGAILKGDAPFDAAAAQKRADRIVFLAGLLDENFPESSNLGEPDSKAKAALWEQRADFEQKLKRFQDHAAALVEVSATEKGATEAFDGAVATAAQDCKGCHDAYKTK
jgi:cytochrome c556